MKMIWKTIKGYNNVYRINNLGQVKRVIWSHGCKMGFIGHVAPDGYKFVILCKNKKHKKYPIHRLVAKYFIGNPTKKRYDINHIDGNKQNNKVTNLEYCTSKENTRHAIKIGLRRPGTNYRLTKKQVVSIRKEYSLGKINQTDLGKKYNVCQVNISSIINYKIHKNL